MFAPVPFRLMLPIFEAKKSDASRETDLIPEILLEKYASG
jgi:hypothetical protein